MRRVLVTLGIAVGALAVGVGAAAAVDGVTADDVPTDGSTTTTEASTTTTTIDDGSTTTTTTDESTTTTTTEELTTTTTTEVPAADAPKAEGETGDAPFGLCNAFSGRPQPGNSQAWARLDELAGGDIEGYCAEVLEAHRAKHADEDEGEDETDDAARPAHPNGHKGQGKGHGKGHQDD